MSKSKSSKNEDLKVVLQVFDLKAKVDGLTSHLTTNQKELLDKMIAIKARSDPNQVPVLYSKLLALVYFLHFLMYSTISVLLCKKYLV